MSIVLVGSTSGSVTLQEPAIAGSTVVNLPSVSMNIGQGGGNVATNTAFGTSALAANTTGAYNTAVGGLETTSNSALQANTTGSQNVALGSGALGKNTTASNNVAVGFQAALDNTTGIKNTAVGASSFQSNTTGVENTAVGQTAIYSNTTGIENTAIGAGAMYSNTSGGANVAMGVNTFYFNTTGSYNTALGRAALGSNTTASYNTAVGYYAGNTNITGQQNTLIGALAGNVLTGGDNTFIGQSAGSAVTNGTKSSILGRYSGNQGGLDIRTTNNNVVLSDGDGNVVGYWNSSNAYVPRMGSGAGSNAVKYNTSSKELTFDTSSARYKDNIRNSVYGLASVMALRSTMFEYKKENRTDVGLIAEEVDLVIPELVGKNADGQPDSVSYDRMVSVLVKAIQELKAEFDAYKASHP